MVRIAEYRARPGAASRGSVYSARSVTVMSRPAEDRAIVDAGLTALAFDSGPPLACDEPAARYVSGGGLLATGNASLTRKPRSRRDQAQFGTVELGDGANQAQPQAVSRRRPAAFATIEAIGQARQVGLRHGRSVILDQQQRTGCGVALEADIDMGARRRVAQCILH
jgi:hypothetical protein